MGFMSASDSSCPRLISRRGFLKSAAAVTATTAAGAVLAACGSQSDAAKVAQSDIPVGGAVISGEWVVAQPQAGQFVAYSNVCPHAQGVIDKIEKEGTRTVAVCPKHQSKFDVTTGDVVAGPSRDGLKPAKKVQAADGQVEVS
nr:Rieske (2Fe-2S) protein [uncultured Corynebacterium sp.]